jgi:hypothetical protein
MKVVLSIAGLIAIALGPMCFTMPAGSLPLPDALGHQAGSQVVHYKDGIVALVAGIVCFCSAIDRVPNSACCRRAEGRAFRRER